MSDPTLNNVQPTPRTSRARSILALFALVMIFCVTAFATLAARAGYSAVARTEETDAKSPLNSVGAFPRVSEKMQSDLAAAFEPNLQWATASIHDPFIDREGYGGSKLNMPVTSAAPGGAAPGSMPMMPGSFPGLQQPVDAAAAARATEERAAKERIKGHEYDPSAYSYKEVLPLGVTGKGRQREVLFYGLPSKKYFSVSVSSRLRDATLQSITEDGVVFSTPAGTVSVGWSRVKPSNPAQPRASAAEQERPAKPQVNAPDNNQPNNPAQPYDGLQYAVRDRYQRTP